MNRFFSNKYVLSIVTILVAVAIGFLIGEKYQSEKSNFSNINVNTSSGSSDQKLFGDVLNIIHSKYFYSNISNSSLYYGAIKGMVSSLGDPHTLFFTPNEALQYQRTISGNSFAGIGVSLGYSQGKVAIEQVLPNTPAANDGISVGDIIEKIDGSSKNVTNISDVVNMVRGISGTKVDLLLQNPAGKTVNYNIERKTVHVSSIYIKKLSSGIVDMEILRFSDSSLSHWESNFRSKVSQIEAMHPKGIIIDLRGDPGGFFEAAIYAAGEFLPMNSLVSIQQNRNGSYNKFYTSYQGSLQNIPMEILVNGGTASAAEILSGALQYYKRATIIGENTYGKGTAQNVFTFSNGSILILTTEHWLLPSYRWITPKHPIIPNVLVHLSVKDFQNGVDTQLQKAISLLKLKIE